MFITWSYINHINDHAHFWAETDLPTTTVLAGDLPISVESTASTDIFFLPFSINLPKDRQNRERPVLINLSIVENQWKIEPI